MQYPDAVEEFEYDMAGNRIKRAFNNITTSYDYDRRNRLSEKVEGGIQTSYRYDPQGNLIAEEGRYGTTKYTYDCFNRTASIHGAKGGYVQNRYDPEGLRYELLENGKLSRFIFSGGEVVTEVDANNSLKAAIVRGHEILAQKDVRDNSYYYLNNAHGDVVNLTDSRGTVVTSYKYDAFVNTVEAVEKVQNRFRYAGEQYDQVTRQYYLRARFYNPVVGRFTQEDTYRGDGLNLYSYVRNNPVKYIDPSGYCGEKSNLWNDFQKSTKRQFKSRTEAATEYKRLMSLTQLEHKASSGAVLEVTTGKTTTILGTYMKDTKYIVSELGNIKTKNFEPRENYFNVLNVPDELYINPTQFWNEYNRPWLDNAIARDDVIIMATTPELKVGTLFRKNASGRIELSGFGKEYLHLRKNGYVFDPVTNQMINK